MVPGISKFHVLPDSIKISDNSIQAEISNVDTGIVLAADITTLTDSSVRVQVQELKAVRKRFSASDALIGEPVKQNLQVKEHVDSSLKMFCDNAEMLFQFKPFSLSYLYKETPIVIANQRGLMRFDAFKQMQSENVQLESDDMKEYFGGFVDSKPHGSSCIAMDFTFPDFQYIYGLPEHGDSFCLRDTKEDSPYRLYNLDVSEYELDSRMSLYGAVPFIMGHNQNHSVGLYWQNASETWVDVETVDNKHKTIHIMSETGLMDFFVLLGPTPKDVMRQYTTLTGTTPLPPMWSLGYHQCRWSYVDEDDVRKVVKGFDKHNIPLDVMWLDIGHTDAMKYFTWHPTCFSNPNKMINNVASKGRKLVTIVDPHVKKDEEYFLFNECDKNRFYIKNKDGNAYVGKCWPEDSYWPDFVNGKVRKWWAGQFLLDKYKGSTLDVFTWNDMNEPSVFNGPERTIPKDCVHIDGWEHRDVHNMYGFYQHYGTYEGQLLRSNGELRPFILTRSFFAGTQRYSAVWTGDNMAKWDHLKASISMLLQLSIAGISFCGADIGGFFYDPDEELLTRWYQIGAWQPFMRGHSCEGTKRREPWLFSSNTTTRIRASVLQRYMYISYWYTLFRECEGTGIPPMRPLWLEYPEDTATFSIEDQYMVGSNILVHPVTDPGSTSVDVYFPGDNDIWFDVDTYKKYETKTHLFSVTIDKVPVFQKGGSIIAKKEKIREASKLMQSDPYTLVVALDKSGRMAGGDLYIDDECSFKYKNGDYVHMKFTYGDGTLVAEKINNQKLFSSNAIIKKILIVGLHSQPSDIHITVADSKRKLPFTHSQVNGVVTINKIEVNIGDCWSIRMG